MRSTAAAVLAFAVAVGWSATTSDFRASIVSERSGGGEGPSSTSSGGLALPRCVVLVYLHVPKTGGTTQADAFEAWNTRGWMASRLFRVGTCETVPPTRTRDVPLPRYWPHLLAKLSNMSTPQLEGLRVAVEAHHCLGLRAIAPELRRLRASLEPRGCRVVVFTRLRHPAATAQSWQHMKDHKVWWCHTVCHARPRRHITSTWIESRNRITRILAV